MPAKPSARAGRKRRDGPAPGPSDRPVAPRNASELRDLRDPRTLRALSHPIRLDLLEALAMEGTLTATQAAELIGESPTTCSFHLRQLQKYGFVEDSGPEGTRERPWRLTQVGNSIPDTSDDPEVELAAGALTKVLLERVLGRVRAWWTERHSYPAPWRAVTGMHEAVWFITPDELAGLMKELEPVMFRYSERIGDPTLRPADAEPIEALFCTYLMRPPRRP